MTMSALRPSVTALALAASFSLAAPIATEAMPLASTAILAGAMAQSNPVKPVNYYCYPYGPSYPYCCNYYPYACPYYPAYGGPAVSFAFTEPFFANRFVRNQFVANRFVGNRFVGNRFAVAQNFGPNRFMAGPRFGGFRGGMAHMGGFGGGMAHMGGFGGGGMRMR